MNVDQLIVEATSSPNKTGCQVCQLTGDAAEVVAHLEQIIREKGRRAVSASALARHPDWQKSVGIGVYPLRDHFRDCLAAPEKP